MDKESTQNYLNRLKQSSPIHANTKAPVKLSNPSEHQKQSTPLSSADITATLVKKINNYLSDDEVKQVMDAYYFAEQAHEGQMRDSGLPYITHPVAVCEICTDWRLDVNSLIAALLHDVIEDQDISKEELIERYNEDVADIVDGVTKLEKVKFTSKAEQQAESFRKMLLAMAKDVRVIIIKLADRLHNMRTLDGVTPEKARRVALETLEIYAPIADRLGLNSLVREFHNLCIKAAHPFRYRVLNKALTVAKGNRREVLSKILDTVNSALPAQGIEAEVYGREKSIYSIHKKMQSQKKSFSEVLDLHGFRIIVNTLNECYLVIGILHQLYRPVPGKFKDYIAIPKINGYQSLHTTLVGPYGNTVEFQIRTRDMHNVAEQGIVSHWLYKSADKNLNNIQEQTNNWLKSLLDIQSQTNDSSEFIENVKVDLFPDQVFVLTPGGQVISLPRGATPIDFAYAIHTDIGNHVQSVKVNHIPAALDTRLNSGDTIEVITSDAAMPKNDWMEFVRTGRARSEIRSFLKKSNLKQSIDFGRKLLEQAMQDLNIQIPPPDDKSWDHLVEVSSVKNIDEIYLDIGLGTRLAPVVARRFINDIPLVAFTATVLDEMATANRSTILIQGKEGQAVQLSQCCSPIPGDPIIAVIRPGYGIIVHTSDCPIAIRQKNKEPERWVDVAWDKDPSKHLHTRIDVIVENEKGVLGAILVQIASADSNLINVSNKNSGSKVSIVQLTIQVEDRNHLARIIKKIRHVRQVHRVHRVKG